jgi:uncharacterized protein YjbJ (UPF0337 family)
MTNKNIDKAKGRVKEAAGALTGNRRLKNEGRVDHARGSAENSVAKFANTLNGRKENSGRHARTNATQPWEVTMLTILLIIIVILLLAGGLGYSHRRGRLGA